MDHVRQMDNPDTPNIIQPSAGIHIVLPGYYSPRSMGLLDPSTSDGRVIFFLPWEGGRRGEMEEREGGRGEGRMGEERREGRGDGERREEWRER